MMRLSVLTCVLAGVMGADVPDALAEDDACRADGSDSACALNELQRREGQAGEPPAVGTWKTGVSFPGGGWKSQTQLAGITAGLSALLGKDNCKNGTLVDLYSSMDAFISVSGGGWYFSSMAYSPYYQETLEACAANPEEASEIYNTRWSENLIKFKMAGPQAKDVSLIDTNSSVNIKERFEELKRSLGSDNPYLNIFNSLADNIQDPISVAGHGKFDWYTYTGSFLLKTAGIGADLMVGARTINEFARNKLWIAGSSIPTPSKGSGWSVIPYETTFSKVSYQAGTKGKGDLPWWIPTKYSVVLGQGISAKAPFPFCGDPTCFGLYLEYTGTSLVPFYRTSKESPQLGSTLQKQFGSWTGSLLLHDVISTSSSAASEMALVPGLRLAGTLAAWTAQSVHPYMKAAVLLGLARERGSAFVGRTVKDFADYGLVPIADGCLTDNTGILHGAEAGLSEITTHLVLNDKTMMTLSSDWDGLPEYIKIQAPPGALTGAMFPIFEMTGVEMHAEFKKMTKFKIAENSQCVEVFKYGSIETKTIANPWTGVQAGNPIKINMISPTTKASLAGGSDFNTYGVCVQEIIQTILDPANAELSKDILDNYYLGIGGKTSTVESSC